MAGWARSAIWRVLDTHFVDGSGFAGLWARWEQDPQRPTILHYVAITPVAPDLTLLRALMPGRRHPDFPAPLPGTAGSALWNG